MREGLTLAGGLAAVAAATLPTDTAARQFRIRRRSRRRSCSSCWSSRRCRRSAWRWRSRSRPCSPSTSSFCRRSARSRSPTRRTGSRCSRSSRSAWWRATSRRSRAPARTRPGPARRAGAAVRPQPRRAAHHRRPRSDQQPGALGRPPVRSRVRRGRAAGGPTWECTEAGPLNVTLDLRQLSLAFAGAQQGSSSTPTSAPTPGIAR